MTALLAAAAWLSDPLRFLRRARGLKRSLQSHPVIPTLAALLYRRSPTNLQQNSRRSYPDPRPSHVRARAAVHRAENHQFRRRDVLEHSSPPPPLDPIGRCTTWPLLRSYLPAIGARALGST